MNVPLLIARRYLFSKKNRNVINIISGIAATGVCIGSFAMIVVLSAFNGLEKLVAELYTSVDPDIRIMPAAGKTIDPDSVDSGVAQVADYIEASTSVLEETVFMQLRDHQMVVYLRGIEPSYVHYLGLDTHVIEGELLLQQCETRFAVLGYGVADQLNLFLSDGVTPVSIYAAKRVSTHGLSPESRYTVRKILPSAIVALNPEFDYKYVYVPLSFARELLQRPKRVSYIDITLKPSARDVEIKQALEASLGSRYAVKTRYELNEVLFKTNATEKWITFFILVFIMVVATFNLIGSITMLIIDKRNDISLLKTLGLSVRELRKLFMTEGLLIALIGSGIGLALGIALLLLQSSVGFFPLQGGLVDYYPVELHFSDVLAVAAVTAIIGLITSWIPTRTLIKGDYTS
ncbi:MAG: FtsX-like permease family protein [Salibacteraceae bacterium]